MHRSGTTLLTKFLRELGLFTGANIEENHEAIFFLRLNEWILKTCGGSWDNPARTRYLINNEKLSELTVRYLKNVLASPQSLSFWGLSRGLGGSMPQNWGWKDPRNTFTLPIWKAIFPEAKIIHIYRHGMDVAASLKKRSEQQLQALDRAPFRWHNNLVLRKRGWTDSVSCLSIYEGLSLWDQYMQEAALHTQDTSSEYFDLRYEDFLQSPKEMLQNLADFCGLTPNNAQVQAVIQDTNKSRAFSFRKSEELLKISNENEIAEMLRRYGY
jgi:hypothetical protein